MLDKFRCDQIVNFYRACTIPNHVMMVTEYAPCGSLVDRIRKREEPEEHVKAKVILDAAKGLDYLHSNEILHRDIKPDNVIVFSLDQVIDVNAKLTDFGSSRNVNINMMMTNMTFTKGIGTPVNMVPEVVNKSKWRLTYSRLASCCSSASFGATCTPEPTSSSPGTSSHMSKRASTLTGHRTRRRSTFGCLTGARRPPHVRNGQSSFF